VLPEHLTLDHVVPVARGGKSTRGNCVPCCRECNRGKSLHTPAEILLDRIRREKDEKAPGAPAPEKDGDP
jgi:5-methylcytosine-specific restriction endonuclease McrA